MILVRLLKIIELDDVVNSLKAEREGLEAV